MSVTEEQFQEWDAKLAENNFFGGDDPSKEDSDNYEALAGAEPPSKFLNLWGWFLIVNLFTQEIRHSWQAPKQAKKGGKKDKKEEKKEEVAAEAAPAEAAPAEAAPAEEDDFDAMFAETEDDAAAKASAKEKTEASKEKAKKEAVIEKSLVLMEVKPWEAGADLDSLAVKILKIEQDGLMWKEQYKLEPIGYGIFKLIVGCTIEDAKVSIDDLTEKITEDFKEEVQSVDILSFNKA